MSNSLCIFIFGVYFVKSKRLDDKKYIQKRLLESGLVLKSLETINAFEVEDFGKRNRGDYFVFKYGGTIRSEHFKKITYICLDNSIKLGYAIVVRKFGGIKQVKFFDSERNALIL